MLQRDYFMRMTEMLAAVLTKILFNKENKNYEDAEKEIESGAKTIVGLDLKLISVLNAEDVIGLMKSSDIYAGRCLVSAELLKEYGDILAEKNKSEQSINIYNKSLYLYVEALLTEELPAPESYYPRVNFLIKNLSQSGFSRELILKLIDYFEMSGQYSKAEDLIFEVMDEDAESMEKKALTFYNKLRDKSEEELIKGNLSREEIEESIEEIKLKFKS